VTATVTQLLPRPERTLILRCGHEQQSRAKAGSTLTCQTCGDRGKITPSIVAAAEAKAAPDPSPPAKQLASSPARLPAARWAPQPIARHQPERDPGPCPQCGTARLWAGRASMTWCQECEALALAPESVRAHSRAAGLQQHRDTSERDADAQGIYQRVEALLDGLDPLLDDKALDASDRGELRWLRDELVKARRDKNSARVAELAGQAADLDLDADEVWEPDVSLDDDDQAEAAATRNASPAQPLAFLATRMPAPHAAPVRRIAPATPGKLSRQPVSLRRKQPRPRNWLVPIPAAPALHPVLLRGDAARTQMQRDAKQITAGLAQAAARGQHITPSQLAEGSGNPWRVPEPGGGPKLVAAELYQLPASGRAGQPGGLRRLLRRGPAITAPGPAAIEGGAAFNWYAQYDAAQAAAWTATAAGRQL
jgi:hypothetical protein